MYLLRSMMKTRIQKWGNSLALRIPRTYATETGLDVNTPVEVQVVDGRLIITPLIPITYELDDLLAQVTDENRHNEIETGASVGDEAW